MRRWTGIVLIGATACLLSACGSGSAAAPGQPTARILRRTPQHAARTVQLAGHLPRTLGRHRPDLRTSSSTHRGRPEHRPTGTGIADRPPPPRTAGPPTGASPPRCKPICRCGPTTGGGSSANPVDGTSSRWFDTFCSAMSTAASTRDALDSVNAGDAASEQSTLLGLLITMGDTFTAAAATLSGLGAPPVTGGDTWPATVQSSLATTAQQLTDTATALAAADPNDTTAQATATDTLITHTDQAQQLVQSIADTDLSDTQRAALGQLPSCHGVIG